jgi:hypothetical protein
MHQSHFRPPTRRLQLGVSSYFWLTELLCHQEAVGVGYGRDGAVVPVPGSLGGL